MHRLEMPHRDYLGGNHDCEFAPHTRLGLVFISPILIDIQVRLVQGATYLVAMALIAGARTFHQVRASVRVGFMPIVRVYWFCLPFCLGFAQVLIDVGSWPILFEFLAFLIGIYINTLTKKKRLAALRRKHFGISGEKSGPKKRKVNKKVRVRARTTPKLRY